MPRGIPDIDKQLDLFTDQPLPVNKNLLFRLSSQTIAVVTVCHLSQNGVGWGGVGLGQSLPPLIPFASRVHTGNLNCLSKNRSQRPEHLLTHL